MPAPPVSALQEVKKIPAQIIEDMRSRFVLEAKNNVEEYDVEDIDCVETNDWQIQRYLLEHKNDPQVAYSKMLESMKWRKTSGVKLLKESQFPTQLFKCGYMCIYGRDINGAINLIVRCNIHKKIIQFNELIKNFFLLLIERIDRNNDGKGVTLILDCSGIGFSNMDLDLLKFIVTSFSNYYPRLFDCIIIHELPFVLQFVFKLVQTWSPPEYKHYFHLTSKKSIYKLVAKDQLPDFMGGCNPESYRVVPQQVLSSEELARNLGVDEKELKKLFLHMEPFMGEEINS